MKLGLNFEVERLVEALIRFDLVHGKGDGMVLPVVACYRYSI